MTKAMLSVCLAAVLLALAPSPAQASTRGECEASLKQLERPIPT